MAIAFDEVTIPVNGTVLDMLAALNPEAKSAMTEAPWRQAWQQFTWGANDAPGSGK